MGPPSGLWVPFLAILELEELVFEGISSGAEAKRLSKSSSWSARSLRVRTPPPKPSSRQRRRRGRSRTAAK